MADIRIKDLPLATGPTAPTGADFIALDGLTTRKTSITALGDVAVPIASQGEAEAGVNAVKRMVPVTVKQSIASEVGETIASAAQGLLADSAVQPEDLGDSATLNVGDIAGTVAAGDDSRIVAALRSVASVAAIKALVPYAGLSLFLNLGAASGAFAWQLGDYSAQVAADTNGAIYIKANTVSSATGAFVRQGMWPTTGVCAEWCATLQDALNLSNALGLQITYGVGAYTLSSALTLPVSMTLDGRKRMIVKQANGANLGETVTMSNSSAVKNINFDGNWANNTATPAARVFLRVGAANDCVIEGNTFVNCQENVIGINAGLRAKVRGNKFNNARDFAVFVFGTAFAEAYHVVEDNDVTGMGWAPFFFQFCDGVSVFNNRCTGNHIGGRNGRIIATSSGGNTVTWVSGPQFSTVRVGNYVIANGGGEYRVLAVVSPTVLTVGPDPNGNPIPNLVNVQISVGSGDLCGITACSFFQVRKNIFKDTATYGCGSSLSASAVQCGNGFFADNQIINPGKNGINLATFGGLGAVENISISGNKIFNPGYAGGIGALDRLGILISGASVSNVNIVGNTVLSYAGEGQTTYWLGFDGGQPYGACSVQGNRSVDLANATVLSDVVSVVLSAGWGSTATVTDIVSYGNTIRFAVNCSGTGFSAAPNLTVLKHVCSGEQTPLPSAKVVSNAGGALLVPMYGEQLSTRGQWITYLGGTPAAGHVYVISMTI